MANAFLGLSQRTMIPDISRRPTRIQDIPKEILGLYGIMIINEEGFASDDDEDSSEPGRLVIDESDIKPDIKSEVDSKIFIKDLKVPTIIEIGGKPSAASRKEIQRAIQQFQISTSKDIQDVKNIAYCNRCKKLTDDIIGHNGKHCFFDGCPDIIDSESERLRHKKMHDHPTKPLQCKFCKKRYRYHSYVEKHAFYCKSKSKNARAKENWRRETAKASSF